MMQGTVVRVFSVPEGAKLFELRRGFATSAMITSLSFSVIGFCELGANVDLVF